MKSLKTRAAQLERSTVQVPNPDESKPDLTTPLNQESPIGDADVAGDISGNVIIRNAQEILDQEKAEREFIEKAAREKTEQEAAEEKAEHDAAEKVALDKAEREAVEIAAREKTEHEAIDKAAEPPSVEPKEPEKTHRKLKAEYIIATIGVAATILVALIGILPQIIKPVLVPTAKSTTTIAATMPLNPIPTTTFISSFPSETPELSLTPTEAFTHEKTLRPAENVTSTPNASNTQKIYFVSANKLNVLDASSGQVEPIAAIGSYSSLFWFDDSEIASWSQDGINIINSETGVNRFFKVALQKHNIWRHSISDISVDRKFLFSVDGGGTSLVTIFSNSIDIDGKLGALLEITTFRATTLYCMKWNPDGSKVAFTRQDSAQVLPELVILGYGANAQPTIIKRQIGGCISWSPDGKYVAYGNGNLLKIALLSSGTGVGDHIVEGIYYIEIISGNITKLTDTNGYYPIWSTDGKTIAFLTEQGISVIDVETKIEKQIYQGDVSARCYHR